jgi:hypothetical protein
MSKKEVAITSIEALLSRINQKVSELKLTPPIKLTADKFENNASKIDWALVSGRFVMENKDDDAFIRDLVLLYLVKKEDNNLDQKFLTYPEDAGSSLHVIIRYNQQNFLHCISYDGKGTD